MNESLRQLYWDIWISLGFAIFFGVLLFIAIRHRQIWLWYTAAEEAFSLRLGISKKWANASRRFSEGRYHLYALSFFIFCFLLLAFIAGTAYIHFKHRLPAKKPPEAESFYDAGARQSKAGNYAGAISNFNQAIMVYSNYAEAYSFRARAKYNVQDYNGAVTDANKAIELDPHFEPAYNVRGDSRFSLGDYAGSIVDFNKSINLDSTYAYAYKQRGLAEANLTNYPPAIEDFTVAIKLKPGYSDAFYDRGIVEQGMTNYTAAIADFSKAIELRPDFSDAYNRRGLAKWFLKDYPGTIIDCTEAIKQNSNSWAAYNNRGLAKNDLKNYAEALVDLDKSIKLDDSNSFAYYNRGLAKHHLGNDTGGIADLNRAVELNPKEALDFAELGMIENNLFQFDPALRNFQKALQLDPSLDNCRLRIWLIRSRLDDKFRATEELKEHLASLKHKKNTWSNVIGLYLVGSLSERSDRIFLDCAKSLDPKTQRWWQCQANYYIGMKHLIDGDKPGAMDFFHQCLNTKEVDFPEYVSAEVELKALEKVIPP